MSMREDRTDRDALAMPLVTGSLLATHPTTQRAPFRPTSTGITSFWPPVLKIHQSSKSRCHQLPARRLPLDRSSQTSSSVPGAAPRAGQEKWGRSEDVQGVAQGVVQGRNGGPVPQPVGRCMSSSDATLSLFGALGGFEEAVPLR